MASVLGGRHAGLRVARKGNDANANDGAGEDDEGAKRWKSEEKQKGHRFAFEQDAEMARVRHVTQRRRNKKLY